jgi:iron complex transport system substrate-binding protein
MTGRPKARRLPAPPQLLPSQQHSVPFFPLVLLLAFVLVAATALLAAGCGSGTATTTAATATTVTSSAAGPGAADTSTTGAATGATTPTTGAAGQTAATGTFPVTIKDDDGINVTIKAKPARIVSTKPASTEILFAIGAGDRVVGVSSLDDYPPQVKNIAKVGDFEPNPEAVMGLSPDLVVSYSGYEEKLQAVQAAGAAVLTFNPVSVEGIFANITALGVATGNTGQAAALVDSLKTQIAQISAAAKATGSAPEVFYAVDNTLYTIGPNTFVDDLLKMANAVNVASMLGNNANGQQYYQYSPEQLVAADPDIILLPTSSGYKNIQEFTKDPRFAQMTAVKGGQVFLIDDTTITRPGPRIAEGLKILVKAIHPDAAL